MQPQVARQGTIYPSVREYLIRNGRENEIEDFEWAQHRVNQAELPETKIVDVTDSYNEVSAGYAPSAWKPFYRDTWRPYAAEVLRLKPNAAQVEISALELKLTQNQIQTLDPQAPRFTADQGRFLDSIDRYKRTGCGAGNSVGKSDAVAVAARYLYDKDYKVIIIANTLDQVQDVVFAYIRTQHENALPGSGGYLYPERPMMKYTHEHVLQALATDTKIGQQQVKGLSGRHYAGSEGTGGVAVIIDEAQGASEATIQTAQRLATGPRDKIILIYNPTDPGCAARKAMKTRRKDGSLLYNEVKISGENHPNVVYDREVIPGAVSREFIESQFAFGGNTRTSAWFRSSVLGEWPDDKPDALISEECVLAAQERGKHHRPNDWRGKALGVDVSGEGGDLTAAFGVDRAKAFMPPVLDHAVLNKYKKVRRGYAWHVGRETTACEQLIYAILNCDPEFRHVGLDDTGLGQGVRDNLADNYKKHFPKFTVHRRTDQKDLRKIQVESEEQANWTGFTFGASPRDPADNRFVNVKGQLLWHLAEKLRNGEFDLPTDDELLSYGLPAGNDLIEQLTRCIYGVTAEKKLIIMDKRTAQAPTETMREQAKQLSYDSPDLLHALAIACWVYFKILRPGPAPIETNKQLRAVQQQRIVRAMVQKRQNPLGRMRGKMPWQRR